MGVESKIRELMEGAANRPKDKQQGDASSPAQGSSDANPEIQDLSGTGNKEGGLTAEVGKKAADKESKDTTLPKGAGAKEAPANFETKKEEVESEEEAIVEDEVVTDEVIAEDEVVAETEEIDIEEDVNALLGGEELSEEFKEKAKTIFEAAINAKVAGIKEELEAQYQEKLAEEIQSAKESLAERVDSYLEYVSDEWFEENSLAIETGLKTEMTESFLEGMKGLFEEHYVSIPEDKYDVLESMVEKLDDMETKLNEQIEKNISLNGRLSEATADGILDEVSEGLAVTQKEKLASLSESVEFESEAQYREKLETLKESYFSKATVAKTETLSEGVDSAEGLESHSASMSAYLRTLGSFGKN